MGGDRSGAFSIGDGPYYADGNHVEVIAMATHGRGGLERAVLGKELMNC